MNNNIDNYFLLKFSDQSLCQIEVREYQDMYKEIWEKTYNDMIHIIKSMCIYQTEITHYNNYVNEVKNYIDFTKPLLLNIMLDNFSLPESPEKNGWGNGTWFELQFNEGMVYRNACMMFYEYVCDEYSFPDNEYIDNFVNNYLNNQ